MLHGGILFTAVTGFVVQNYFLHPDLDRERPCLSRRALHSMAPFAAWSGDQTR